MSEAKVHDTLMRVPEAVRSHRFDPSTKEMYLESHPPNVTIEEVRRNVGWDPAVPADVRTPEPPSKDALRPCRTMRDPVRRFLG